MTDVAFVFCRWDRESWYAEAWSGDDLDDAYLVTDSQKIFFPVDVEAFARDQLGDLESALRQAFPRAQIEFSGESPV